MNEEKTDHTEIFNASKHQSRLSPGSNGPLETDCIHDRAVLKPKLSPKGDTACIVEAQYLQRSGSKTTLKGRAAKLDVKPSTRKNYMHIKRQKQRFRDPF